MKFLVLFIVFLTSCTITTLRNGHENGSGNAESGLVIRFTVDTSIASEFSIRRALAVLSAPDITPLSNELSVDVSNRTVSGEIRGIPTGNRRCLSLYLYDSVSNLIGEGQASNIVITGIAPEPISLKITLKTGNPSRIIIQGLLTNTAGQSAYTTNLICKAITDYSNYVIPFTGMNFQLIITNNPAVTNTSLLLQIIHPEGFEAGSWQCSNIPATPGRDTLLLPVIALNTGRVIVNAEITNDETSNTGDTNQSFFCETFETWPTGWFTWNGALEECSEADAPDGLYAAHLYTVMQKNDNFYTSPRLVNKTGKTFLSFLLKGNSTGKALFIRAGSASCYWAITGPLTNAPLWLEPAGSPSYTLQPFDTAGQWVEVRLSLTNSKVPAQPFELNFRGGAGGTYDFYLDKLFLE